MAERLRIVSEQLPRDRVGFLSEEAQVVGTGGGASEVGLGTLQLSQTRQQMTSQKVHMRKVPSPPATPSAVR